MKNNSKILTISVSLGLTLWLADTLLDHFVFFKRPFWDTLILNVPTHEIYFRSLVMLILLAFGLWSVYNFKKQCRIESALRFSENRFRRTADNISDGLTIIENDMVVYANDRACEIFGYPLEEFKITDGSKLVAPEDIEKVQNLIKEKKLQGTYPDEMKYWIVRKDGTRRYVHNRYSTNFENGVLVARYVLTSDITERKITEDALKNSEKQYHTVIDSLGDAIHVVDRDLRVVLVNKGLLKWHDKIGVESDMIGRSIFDVYTFLPEKTKDEYRKAFDIGETIVTRESVRLQGREVMTETRKIPIFENDRVSRVITVIRDITSSKMAEEKLRKREAQLRATMQSLPFDFFALDEDGRYILQNNTCRENWGNLMGKKPEDMAPNEHCKKIWTNNNSRAFAGETVDEEIVCDVRGERRHIHNIIAPIYDDGKPSGILGMNMDITKRKRAEAALLESEEKYSNLFHNSSDAIFIHDLDGRIIDINKKVIELFGYSREEILKLNIADLHPEYMHESSRRAFDTIKRNKSVFFELDFKKKSSETFPAELSSTIIELGGRQVIQGIVRDITVRKLTLQALEESEERFRLAFQTSPDSININRLEDGLYVHINDGFTSLTGYTEEDVLGKTSLELNIWENPKDRQKLIEELRQSGFINNLEARFKLKDGTVRTGLMSAKVINLNRVPHILSITRDVEEWKKAEEARRQSEERFRAVFESARDTIFIKNSDLQYVIANPSMERLFGIPVADIIGKTDGDLYDIKTAEQTLKVDQRVLRGEIIDEEHTESVDGAEKIFHVIKVPMRDAQGEINGLCGIARDVTDTRHLQEFASRAQRLETAGRIAGQVAHDFNNLLGPLVAYPELIKDELSENSKVLKYVDAMERSAQKIADINQQLLTLGRRAHYEQTPMCLNEIVRDVLMHIQPSGRKIEIKTDLEDDLMNFIGGAAQIHRVVTNLVVNAYDAMDEDGILTIRTENYYLDESYGDYEHVPKGEYVKLTISDTGNGIPSEIMNKIFDPFFTTKSTDKHRGSGLGLSVVHAVMEDHNGFIDCKSEPDQGASFYIYFPVTREEVENGGDNNIYGGDETILVVDDDSEQRDVSAKLLEKLGYHVLTATGGEDAVRQVEEGSIDIVLLDMIMAPEIDGAETYRRILEIRPDQKAIIVSGYARTDRAKYALELGASCFLKKPLTLKSLSKTIRKALEEIKTEQVSG